MLIDNRVQVVHGCVVAVALEPVRGGADRWARFELIVQGEGKPRALKFSAPSVAVAVGDVVSAALLRASRLSRVLAFHNHTTQEGVDLVGRSRRLRPDGWDALIASACVAGAGGALGWHGLLLLVPLGCAYWLLTYGLPTAIRSRLSGRIAFLINQSYMRHPHVRQTAGAPGERKGGQP
ncbi:hypothetical protein P3W85_00360 [Cupriavidus basilensis]|uniref:Uncharacterized protein n=1 Tax=Cupriavidus basilensis TaxID=68895 RepID=A0ABT6AFN6_9BURK|nr:hypothetical protein [Cupriavidus basilensis]MDF3831421.1 hypothetical protein [Cupriavidus basilensis]